MYLEYFGFKEPPFKITPQSAYFFEGASRGATLDALMYAISHGEGMVKVVGEVGAGKTMLCRMLIDRFSSDVKSVYIANPRLDRDALLCTIADELGLVLEGRSQASLIRRLQYVLIEAFGEGQKVVVLIDEAHAMPIDSLEEIRLLSNLDSGQHKLLQLVLFGQPELDQLLAPNNMRQFRERITYSFTLLPFGPADVGAYIRFRCQAAGYHGPDLFSNAAIKSITRASEGLSRRINILADKALLSAFVDHVGLVSQKHARAAIKDSELKEFPWLLNPVFLASLALFLLGLFTLGFVLLNAEKPKIALPAAIPAITPPKIAMELRDKPASAPKASSPQTPVLLQSLPLELQSTAKTSLPWQAIDIATQKWLNEAPNETGTIQVLLASGFEIEKIQAFINEIQAFKRSEPIWVYAATLRGKPVLGVLIGTYANKKLAQEAISSLPAGLLKYKPIARTAGGIRQEQLGQ